ncbi:hypothetical protein BGX23_012435 [Mortierella sp. AD031]|nr:hypothetical protein BGX23_012435 [Mortierella sp. AD031]
MSYTFSSSFNYTPDVVDFEAMNITDMFPEQSSFSFDISNSYSDSISGIPLAQQALWDDGQLTLPNSSRVFNASSLSSSVNSSINYGHPHQHQQQYHNGQQHQPQPQQQQQQQQQSPRHLLVPSSHHGRHTHPHPLSQQQQYQGSPLRADDGYLGSSQDDENNEESGYNVHGDESSGHLGWMDDTKDQQGMMLHYNDQERRDEQHLQFLQDIGAGSLSRGDSISLFDKLDDASELSCDLFKEEIDIDETGDQSRLPFNNAGGHFENEIFDREFMASLKTAPTSFSPMDSPNNNSSIRRNPNNILDGLHSIPAPVLDHDESINIGHRKRGTRYDGSERSGTGETYQRALKSFFDSLKVADPIKTPHKFAPQPLPILWNEPKIRSKNLPSFNLADYKDVAKSTMVPGTPPAQFKSMTTAFKSAPLSATTGLSNRLNGNKRDSFSSSPTNTHSMPNSAHSSPLSSMSTSPPTASLRSKMPIADPKTPTAATYNSKLTHSPSQPQQQLQQLQQQQPETEQEPPQRLSPTPQRYSPTPQQQLSPTTSEQRVRSKRRSTIVNPHLAFDPTIPPSEREKTEELKTPTTTPRGTLERRSTLQQATRPKLSAPEDPKSDEDAGVSGQQQQHQQGTLGRSGSAIMSGLRGPAVHMFTNDLNQDDQVHQQQHPREEFQDDDQDIHQQQQQHQQQDGGLNHRGSRPLSANILPESLTSVNNHAIHKESANVERVRRLSEEERGQQGENVNGVALAPGTPTSRLPAALTLGRAAGARFGRSGSGSTGSLAQMSPTTPTAANPYGSLSGRTAATALAGRQANSADQPHRLSLTGMTAAFARQQLDDAAAADSPSTPTQSQYMPKLQQSPSTLSRSDTRSSPPSAGLRRPGYATQEPDFQKDYGGGGGSSNLSSPTEQYDDYYRAEKEFQMQQQQQQQQPVRSSYLRHQLQKQQDQENEWYGDEEPRRMPTSPMKTRQAPSLDQQREQRDQKHLQRLRIQQQALEDVYGHGAGYGGNDYADDQGFVDDRLPSALPQQQPQHSRYQSQLSPRHQHHSPPSPLSPSSRDYLSMNATTPKAGSHQQQSRSATVLVDDHTPPGFGSLSAPKQGWVQSHVGP